MSDTQPTTSTPSSPSHSALPAGSAGGGAGGGNQFGTFGGVFTPSILTILGVVMFMSAGVVIGRAGVWAALLILLLSKMITALTSLSIAAISTNTPVKGGGAYYLISRSLGPESGGAIGLTLFLAQALSVPFYILGFTEAFTIALPHLEGNFELITYLTATALLVLNLFGASWAIKIQYVILATLGVAIVIFMGGALQHFEWARFQENFQPMFTGTSAEGDSFWSAFAIYFPAVTGIMTGVNMSGDLKNPSVSIPKGTFWAVAVGALIYGLEILVMSGAQSREQLVGDFHHTLLSQALFGASWLVVAGVFAATLSSALGSLMGAPRILQALSRDDIFPPLTPFAKGSGEQDEPTRGLWFTYLITLSVLWFASLDRGAEGGAGGSALNSVGAVLTMFFLYAYGMTNIAAFAESFSRNPSFRPRFRYFHWLTALAGAIGCFFTALLINWSAALVAIAVIMALYLYVQQRVLGSTYGDVRRGFYYSRMRENLMKLASQPQHPKNWRPNTLVLSGNPHTRHTLTQYALWLENRRGVATLVELLVGPLSEMLPKRERALERLESFIEEQRLEAFCEVLVTESFNEGLSALLQCHAVGPLKPNLVMFGWPNSSDGAERFTHLLRLTANLKLSAVVTVDRGLPRQAPTKRVKRIDVWWRGRSNGSLMLILAYLLTHNIEWSHHQVRVLRSLAPPEGERFEDLVHEAEREIHHLLDEARIRGEAKVVEQTTSFPELLREHSKDATVIFLGLTPPREGETDAEFHQRHATLLARLPTTLLVYSAGEADLTT